MLPNSWTRFWPNYGPAPQPPTGPAPLRGRFLSTLENVLRQVTEVGGNVVAWQRAASEMRRHLLPGLLGDPRALVYAEDLWHQARVVIGERARRAEAYRAWQANR